MKPEPTSGLSETSARAVQGAVGGAALRIERAICAARIGFFAAILFRFGLITTAPAAAVIMTTLPLLAGIAFSAWVVLRVHRAPSGPGLWLVSVGLDAVVAFCALAPNALWPSPEYVGILYVPDTAGLLVAVAAAGLRLSVPASMLGAVLNMLTLVGLALIDRAVSGDRFATSGTVVSTYVLWIAGSSVIATLAAHTSRTLAERGAAAAMRIERAERGLWVVLAEHHDLRSSLGAALLHADALETMGRDGAPAAGVEATAAKLKEALRRVREVVEGVKDRARLGLEDASELRRIDVWTVARRAIDHAALLSPDVSFCLDCAAAAVVARVAGGETGLERILDNLLLNACEGDGRRGASNVTLRVEAGPRGEVRLNVADDGPGMGPHGPWSATGQSKSGGAGVGLAVARALAEASGGSLRLDATEGGGCVWELALGADGPSAAASER